MTKKKIYATKTPLVKRVPATSPCKKRVKEVVDVSSVEQLQVFCEFSPRSTYTAMSCCLTHVIKWKSVVYSKAMTHCSWHYYFSSGSFETICKLLHSVLLAGCLTLVKTSVLLSTAHPAFFLFSSSNDDVNAIHTINRYICLFWFRKKRNTEEMKSSFENVTFHG